MAVLLIGIAVIFVGITEGAENKINQTDDVNSDGGGGGEIQPSSNLDKAGVKCRMT